MVHGTFSAWRQTDPPAQRLRIARNPEGSVQNLSHFQSCDGGSVMLKFHLAQRLHVHILSRAPLRAGDVFQPGRSRIQ